MFVVTFIQSTFFLTILYDATQLATTWFDLTYLKLHSFGELKKKMPAKTHMSNNFTFNYGRPYILENVRILYLMKSFEIYMQKTLLFRLCSVTFNISNAKDWSWIMSGLKNISWIKYESKNFTKSIEIILREKHTNFEFFLCFCTNEKCMRRFELSLSETNFEIFMLCNI